jgi:hypothetical protein
MCAFQSHLPLVVPYALSCARIDTVSDMSTLQAQMKGIGTDQKYSDINRSDQDMVELPASFVAQLPGERVGAGYGARG